MMQLSLRPCQKQDVKQVIPLMYSAGPDAYRFVFSVTEQEQVLDFLHYAFCQGTGEFGYKEHQVAIVDNEIVGLVGLRKSALNFSYLCSALKQILSFYGIINGAKVITRGLKFEKIVPPPRTSEVCLHNLAVKSEKRGQGVGQKIIKHVFSQLKNSNHTFLTLDVAETNPRAKALYSKLGFTVEKFNQGGLKNKFGKAVNHETMRKKITPDN